MGLENMFKKVKEKEKSYKRERKIKIPLQKKLLIKKKQIAGRKESYEAFNKNTT